MNYMFQTVEDLLFSQFKSNGVTTHLSVPDTPDISGHTIQEMEEKQTHK